MTNTKPPSALPFGEVENLAKSKAKEARVAEKLEALKTNLRERSSSYEDVDALIRAELGSGFGSAEDSFSLQDPYVASLGFDPTLKTRLYKLNDGEIAVLDSQERSLLVQKIDVEIPATEERLEQNLNDSSRRIKEQIFINHVVGFIKSEADVVYNQSQMTYSGIEH